MNRLAFFGLLVCVTAICVAQPPPAPRPPQGARQPSVISTEPADGAHDVMGPIVVIIVRFSEPMNTDKWDIEKPDRGILPKLLSDPWFENPRECQLKVEVEPGQSYGLAFTGGHGRGFTAAKGNQQLKTYHLHFKTAGIFGGPAPPPARGLIFRPRWEEGQTRKVTTILINEMETKDPEVAARVWPYSRVVVQIMQATEAPGGILRRVRCRTLQTHIVRTRSPSGPGEPEPVPFFGEIIEAARSGDHWEARSLGQPAEPALLEALVGNLDMAQPLFAPGPVSVGDAWEVSPEAAIVLMLGARAAGPGKVVCQLVALDEKANPPVATIAHDWDVNLEFSGLTLHGVGKGESLFSLADQSFISHRARLDCVMPPQKVEGGRTLQAKGPLTISRTFRYYPRSAYPPLAAEVPPIAVAGGTAPPPGPGGSDRPGPEPPPLEDNLVGTWTASQDDQTIILRLNADGTFIMTTRKPSGPRVFRGTYDRAPGLIILTEEKSGEKILFKFRGISPDEIEVQPERDEPIRLRRQRP